MARSYEESVVRYGETREYAAVGIDGRRRYGARYVVSVDGVKVATVRWQGGRRYWVEDQTDVRTGGWQFITGDGGKVSDVARYVADCWVNDAHDKVEKP